MIDLHALSNQSIKSSYFLIPTQSYSFFINLPPLGFSLFVYEQNVVVRMNDSPDTCLFQFKSSMQQKGQKHLEESNLIRMLPVLQNTLSSKGFQNFYSQISVTRLSNRYIPWVFVYPMIFFGVFILFKRARLSLTLKVSLRTPSSQLIF